MPAHAEQDVRAPSDLRRLIVVLAVGIFVTGFGWPGLVGQLPLKLLLKNQLGLGADRVAAFWAIATAAWYCKPLVGLVCDAYPLFGTRRRAYLVWGSVLAGLFWLGFAVVPRQYGPLMVVMTALNFALVVVSTTVGGLQVEAAQRYRAPGRLASLRSSVEGVTYLAAGPVSGLLAVVAFHWTAVTGAATLLAFAPIAALLCPEPATARTNTRVLVTAKQQLRSIARSRPMWTAALLLFLFYMAPGFQTPILYYQQDVLKLDPRFMGTLQLLGGVGWMVGAAIYAYSCRRVSLRTSLVFGIAANGIGALLYLFYDSPGKAAVVQLAFNVLYTLGSLPLFDLATRATPAGSESFGFGLMMSISNIAIFAVSDVVGSLLYSRYHLGFKELVWVNSVSTLAVLLFLPLIPKPLLAAAEADAPDDSRSSHW